MNKIVVLYRSKYGATKKYAKWLAGDLPADLIEVKDAKIEKVATYDTVILGGGIYASGIAGLPFLKKYYETLKDKKLIVFAVGASPYDEAAMVALRQRNFQGKLADVPCYYCRGAWNEDEMSWVDRILCTFLKKMVAKKDPATYEPWEVALMEAMGTNHDWTDRKYLKQIIDVALDD